MHTITAPDTMFEPGPTRNPVQRLIALAGLGPAVREVLYNQAFSVELICGQQETALEIG